MNVFPADDFGPEHQELKEAVCDALVNLTIDRVSGAGPDGEIIFAAKPNRAVVSGHLLPRYDERGEDDTSDITLSTLGMDIELHRQAPGAATLTPTFSTYVRVLPEWADLIDPGRCGQVTFRLDPAIQQQIDAYIRGARTDRLAAAGLAGADPEDQDDKRRADRLAQRRAIRDAIRREAFAQHGIELDTEDAEPGAAAQGSEAADDGDPLETAAASASGDDEDLPGANVGPDTDARDEPSAQIQVWRQDGRRVPFHLLQPADIPAKWRRIAIAAPPFAFDLQLAPEALRAAAMAYSVQLRRLANQAVRAWLSGPDGQQQAWRAVRVGPTDVLDEGAWGRFLEQARATAVPVDRLGPLMAGLEVTAERQPDFLDPDRVSLRVTLENNNRRLGRRVNTRVDTIFLTGIALDIPKAAHAPLRLDRVEPSYRFRHHLEYAAMGLNCGVRAEPAGERLKLETTWAPRFVQPRIEPRKINVATEFGVLADKDFNPTDLLALPLAYRAWIKAAETKLEPEVGAGLSTDDAQREKDRLRSDLAAQREEARLIERGIQLLIDARAAEAEAQTHGVTPDRLQRAAPWQAWRYTNEAFARRDVNRKKPGWRLFQLAFVLAHIPMLASRMPAYASKFESEADEEAASLLYFPTGGGKSEAFYGTLIFNLFLDRLRGKNRGVTALVRYPLRLLTLQQAQRFLRLLIWAELVRAEVVDSGAPMGAWPFELGFWVGGANTPNRFSQVPATVPFDRPGQPDDDEMEPGPDLDAYVDTQEAFNKIPACPCCKRPTGLRRIHAKPDSDRRLAIICFNAKCVWNVRMGPHAPLPFLLTDDTIYARAPSVIVGTVDKLALLGQHVSTIGQLLGMFGLARWMSPAGHFYLPRKTEDLTTGPAAGGYKPVFPAYRGGERVFFDPFPSLVIQDEAHLLEESLGSFSGLFESLFEQVTASIAEIAGDELYVARWPTGARTGQARSPKIIAATATVSEPVRQLAALYQRTPLRFPYPGPDLYESFFSRPAGIALSERQAFADSLPDWERAEGAGPWSRLYVSLMTNGATHTVTSVAALSAFHTVISRLWRALLDPSQQTWALNQLLDAISPGPGAVWRRASLSDAAANGRYDHILALLDLHRIALAYVTNKKGGDQIMDALESEVRRDHQRVHLDLTEFDNELISGGVNMQEIQRIMERAEAKLPPGSPAPDIEGQMRSVVATSAISHGVDVDRFNSMFFAGLPSDVAEYIQASSRVGRMHVGFVMLIPTPQSRQDRFVVEAHDVFHRFLERMIAPPAIERWAANAVSRVTASVVQAWAMVEDARAFIEAPDDAKAAAPSYRYLTTLSRLAKQGRLALQDRLLAFALGAVGFAGRGAGLVGRPVYEEMYRQLVDVQMDELVKDLAQRNNQIELAAYWDIPGHAFKPPMTSLRDVDEAGEIRATYLTTDGERIHPSAFLKVMREVRRQRGAADADVFTGNPT